MKVGIIGTGAIGGYYGALLGRAGEAVHLIACRKEVEALAAKLGIALAKGTPERLMALFDTPPGGVKASMLQDMERGKPLELESIHGTVVRLGEKLGVPPPVNRTIYAALKLHAGGRR